MYAHLTFWAREFFVVGTVQFIGRYLAAFLASNHPMSVASLQLEQPKMS